MRTLKPFNLEEAKAGKPFTHLSEDPNNLQTVRTFLAVSSTGKIVYDRHSPTTTVVDSCDPKLLRMIVERKIFKGLLFQSVEDPWRGHVFVATDTPENRENLNRNGCRIIKEFEIEYEDL